MKILADRAIPNAREIFSAFGDVSLKAGRQICADDLKGIDALMVRSVTKVDRKLLSKADCLKFVGTATAGVDHIDRDCLADADIAFSAAYGCNAASVCDYILSSLLVLSQRYGLKLADMSLGIVGCGHVGLRVMSMAQALGMRIICHDPVRRNILLKTRVYGKGDPRFAGRDEQYAAAAMLSDGDEFICRSEFGDPELFSASLEDVLKCDVISLHPSLSFKDEDKEHATYHMLSYDELSSLGNGQILINASRGAVVDNEALYEVLKGKKKGDLLVCLDVFEKEPSLLKPELIPLTEIATPHIAGYALEAKNRGTAIIAAAFKSMLRLEEEAVIPKCAGDITELSLSDSAELDTDLLSRLVFSVYDVRRDDALFRLNFKDGASFDALRANYRERHELNSLKVICTSPSQVRSLFHLGFRVSHG